MPFPRRPRGEQPITTIRWQRRQMNQMEQEMTLLRCAIEARDKRIAEYDVSQSEMETELTDTVRRLDDVCIDLDRAKTINHRNAQRLAYLEGYYRAKEGQEAPNYQAIFPAGKIQFGDKPDTDPRSGPRDQENISDERSADEGTGQETHAAGRFGEGLGGSVWREAEDHHPSSGRRSVEHIEITDNQF